jgi:glucose/arabinose dehydrogenase
MAALSLVACGGSDVIEPVGLTVADDLVVEIVHDGLNGPTQMVVLDDGDIVVAVLNGGENEGLGMVLRIDPDAAADTADQAVEVLRRDLDKPTGVAWLDDELWVMERNRLTRTVPGRQPTVVVDDLPNNGRSEGTLTVTPDNLILFNTSGTKRGAEVVDRSGRIFTVDPASSDQPGALTELASGFKNAYAHTFDAEGRLWVTEMSDGRFDGERAADELVTVMPGADHGWPWCVGDNRPVVEFGGTPQRCGDVPPSAAVFAPGATPTSVAVSPFADGEFLVALWTERRVVAVRPGESGPATSTDLVSGLSNPQHLVTVDDAVYLTEFGTGRILKIAAR